MHATAHSRHVLHFRAGTENRTGRSAIYTMLLPLALSPLFTGCIGPADWWSDLPPLEVTGRVVDARGEPAGGKELRLLVPFSSIWHRQLEAVRTDSPDKAWDYYARVRTNQDGSFTHTFPKRVGHGYGAGLFIVITHAGAGAGDIEVLIHVDGEGPTYLVRSKRFSTKAFTVGPTIEDLTRVRQTGEHKPISVSVRRRRSGNTVKLLLRLGPNEQAGLR